MSGGPFKPFAFPPGLGPGLGGASPIVGAPFAVQSWVLVVTIVCKQCDAKAAIHLAQGQDSRCPSCGASYQNVGMRWDPHSGESQARFKIGHSAPAPRPVLNDSRKG
jgi:hypothetical protein